MKKIDGKRKTESKNMFFHSHERYEIPDTGDISQRIFEIVTLTDDRKEAVEEILSEIDRLLSVRDANGRNLLTPIISADRMFS